MEGYTIYVFALKFYPYGCKAEQMMMMIAIIQFNLFIYLRARQQPDKANYSQALKEQYRIKYNMLKSINDLKINNEH
jgi:hypothetical protein